MLRRAQLSPGHQRGQATCPNRHGFRGTRPRGCPPTTLKGDAHSQGCPRPLQAGRTPLQMPGDASSLEIVPPRMTEFRRGHSGWHYNKVRFGCKNRQAWAKVMLRATGRRQGTPAEERGLEGARSLRKEPALDLRPAASRAAGRECLWVKPPGAPSGQAWQSSASWGSEFPEPITPASALETSVAAALPD